MKRALAAVLLGAVVLLAVLEALAQTQQGRTLTSYNVTCSTTPGMVVGHNSARVGLVVLNVGTTHVSVGQNVTIRPFTLHAGAALTLNNYVGSVDCLGSGPTALQVLEETR